MPRRRPPGSESFHFLPFVVEKLSHEIESLHSSGHVITLSPAAALSPRRQIFCIAARPRRTGNHPYKCPAPGFSTFCRWAALLRPDARTVTTRFPVPWEPGNSAAPGSFSCPAPLRRRPQGVRALTLPRLLPLRRPLGVPLLLMEGGLPPLLLLVPAVFLVPGDFIGGTQPRRRQRRFPTAEPPGDIAAALDLAGGGA